MTATSRIFDYRESSGNSISLSSFAYETNIRDQIGWSNLGESTLNNLTTHLSQASTGDLTEISTPQFADTIMPIILRMFPKNGSSPSIVLLGGSSEFESAISNISHPGTSRLVRQLGIDHQFIYMIFQRLVNDGSSARALDAPLTKLDHFFKIGITYCFSLGEEVLVDIINATPSPYKLPLMQNMFSAALVLGNGPVLKMIMMLDRESFVNRPVLLGEIQYYPLEFTSTKHNVETTQALLDHGADPNRHKDPGHFKKIGSIAQGQNEDVSARVQIMRMLLDHDLEIDPDFSSYKRLSYNKGLFSMLLTHCLNKNLKILFYGRALPMVLRHPSWDDSFSNALKAMLDQACSEKIDFIDTWKSVLTEALSSAALCSHTSVVGMLLAMGVTPDVHCLISAAQGSKLDTFEEFLNHGLDPNAAVLLADDWDTKYWYEENYKRKCDSTALGEAIKNQSRGAFQVLQARGVLLSFVDRPAAFAVALVAASQVGDNTLVEHLLSLPSFPRREVKLEKAIESAMEENHHHIVKRLLFAGIKPSIRSLELAVQKKELTAVELLASCMNLADLIEMNQGYYESDSSGIRDIYQNLLIMEALRWGDQTATEHVLRIGHPVNVLVKLASDFDHDWNLNPKLYPGKHPGDNWYFTPLSAAILKGDSTAAKMLIAYGAHVELVSSRLTSHQSSMLVQELNGQSRWSLTPLAAAVVRDNLLLIKEFLRKGVDPFDNSALLACAVLGSEEIMTLLLSALNNQYPDGAQSFGSDALYQCIEDDNLRLVELLAKSADITAPVLDGWRAFYDNSFTSPLGDAIRLQCTGSSPSGALDLLLPLVRNLNAVIHRDHKNGHMTPLLYAISLESLDTVQKLHQAGTDISLPAGGIIPRTPLQAAAEVGSREVVQYLLAQGASPNEPPASRAGATALQLAAVKGKIGIAMILLDAGADINAKPALCDGRTAFEGAAEHGHIEMMIFLVQQGADLLSNNEEQYRRAIAFADDNLQHAAKKLAEDLHQQVLASQVTKFISMGQNEWPETGVDGLGGFVF
jgi:ankyrin repeat protein